MPTRPVEDRRTHVRRIDKITMKARAMVATLKRTIGPNAARRYLAQNDYDDQIAHDMMLCSMERRSSRRRVDDHVARLKSRNTAGSLKGKQEIFGSLTSDDIKALYLIDAANASDEVFIRISDCPPQFIRFGLIELGLHGARTTERGRATLLHWTRARILHATSRGQVMNNEADNVHTWLINNRFTEVTGAQLSITPRGTEWLKTRLDTVKDLTNIQITPDLD
jgi:hypothetical protein